MGRYGWDQSALADSIGQGLALGQRTASLRRQAQEFDLDQQLRQYLANQQHQDQSARLLFDQHQFELEQDAAEQQRRANASLLYGVFGSPQVPGAEVFGPPADPAAGNPYAGADLGYATPSVANMVVDERRKMMEADQAAGLETAQRDAYMRLQPGYVDVGPQQPNVQAAADEFVALTPADRSRMIVRSKQAAVRRPFLEKKVGDLTQLHLAGEITDFDYQREMATIEAQLADIDLPDGFMKPGPMQEAQAAHDVAARFGATPQQAQGAALAKAGVPGGMLDLGLTEDQYANAVANFRANNPRATEDEARARVAQITGFGQGMRTSTLDSGSSQRDAGGSTVKLAELKLKRAERAWEKARKIWSDIDEWKDQAGKVAARTKMDALEADVVAAEDEMEAALDGGATTPSPDDQAEDAALRQAEDELGPGATDEQIGMRAAEILKGAAGATSSTQPRSTPSPQRRP